MKNDVSRIIIETLVKKYLKDIKDSLERSTRNLIDMALNFSDGRFQKAFFATAQTMLRNEQSSYYGLVKNVSAHVDNEKILRFGMNLGYNSCTLGAAQIRKEEETCGYKHPVFTALVAAPGCSEATVEKVYAYLESARKEQIFQTIPWELGRDSSRIDSVISDDSALAFFDEDGYLRTGKEFAFEDCRNLFKSDLSQILQRAFPKK